MTHANDAPLTLALQRQIPFQLLLGGPKPLSCHLPFAHKLQLGVGVSISGDNLKFITESLSNPEPRQIMHLPTATIKQAQRAPNISLWKY